MDNNLFSYQNSDNQDAKVIDPEDFTAVENRTRWYSFAVFIKKRKIDPALGRNTILLFLRIMGLVTRDYRPIPGTVLVKHLRVMKSSDGRSSNTLAYPYYMLEISGEGLWEIKKAIDQVRMRGGSI